MAKNLVQSMKEGLAKTTPSKYAGTSAATRSIFVRPSAAYLKKQAEAAGTSSATRSITVRPSVKQEEQRKKAIQYSKEADVLRKKAEYMKSPKGLAKGTLEEMNKGLKNFIRKFI